MGKRSKKFPSALKHGAYSNTALLPGEDPLAFKELHDGLFAEFVPAGPAEEDVVTTMARLQWRKQNLSTYKLAALARNRSSMIHAKYGPRFDPSVPAPFPVLTSFGREDLRDPDEIRADKKAAEEEIRNELGEALAFVEMADAVTIEQLFKDLEVMDRLDGMIDRCLKRLLMVRGVKSMSPAATAAPSATRKRLAAV